MPPDNGRSTEVEAGEATQLEEVRARKKGWMHGEEAASKPTHGGGVGLVLF